MIQFILVPFAVTAVAAASIADRLREAHNIFPRVKPGESLLKALNLYDRLSSCEIDLAPAEPSARSTSEIERLLSTHPRARLLAGSLREALGFFVVALPVRSAATDEREIHLLCLKIGQSGRLSAEEDDLARALFGRLAALADGAAADVDSFEVPGQIRRWGLRTRVVVRIDQVPRATYAGIVQNLLSFDNAVRALFFY